MHLQELIVHRRISNGRFVEDRVEDHIAKLRVPVEPRNISGNKITAKAQQVFEVARPEVINDNNPRFRMPILQGQGQIRPDKTSAARHQNITHGA